MKVLQVRLLTFLLLITVKFVFAQEYVNYTFKDGLPSNHLYRITQDHDGFLWIITDGGISKFDGTTFKNFTVQNGLPTNDIWNILITNDNKVWYFSKNEKLGYIENDVVYSFSSSDSATMYPVHLGISGNSVHFTGEEFAYHFKDTVWERTANALTTIPIQKDLVYLKLIKDDFYLEKNRRILPGSRIFSSVKASIRSSYNDSIFTVTSQDTSFIYDYKNETGRQLIHNQESSIPKDLKYARFHSINDEIQFTGSNFLGIFNTDFSWKNTFSIPEKINAHFSFKDREGFIWCATFDNGLYKLPSNSERVKTRYQEQEIQLLDVIGDSVFVGTENNMLFLVENETSTLFSDYNSYCYGVFKTGDSLLIPYLTETLIASKNGNRKIIPSHTLKRGKSFVTHKDIVWTDVFSTLLKYEPQSYRHSEFKGNYHNLFSQGNELYVFENKTLKRYNEHTNRFEDFKNEYVDAKVTLIRTYDNRSYIGTEGDGLYLFENDGLKKIMEGDRNLITQISEENKNSIWTIVNRELYHYKITGDGAVVNRFPQVNGFSTNNLTRLAIIDSSLFVGSKNGLHEFKTEDISATPKFDIYVDAIALNDVVGSSDTLTVDYDKDHSISVNFGARNFSGTLPRYEYRLLPLNNRWTRTEVGVVHLSNLEPGKYSLELKATVNNYTERTQVPITIRPLWFQKPISKIVLLLLILGLFGYIVYRTTVLVEDKKRKRLAQEKRLSEIQLRALRTQMNPHFVFNSLSAIQYFFNENDNDKGDDYLVKFSRLIRQFFDVADKKEVKISEEKELLTNYLEVEKLRFKDKFTFKIDLPNEMEQQMMPSMLLQPIVENSINHGIFNKELNGVITITFARLVDDWVEAKIIDNGVGFDTTQKGNDLRLKSSKVLEDRLFYLNQSKEWQITVATSQAFPDKKDVGHKTVFKFKLKK